MWPPLGWGARAGRLGPEQIDAVRLTARVCDRARVTPHPIVEGGVVSRGILEVDRRTWRVSSGPGDTRSGPLPPCNGGIEA